MSQNDRKLDEGKDDEVFLSLAPRCGAGYAKSYTEGLDFAFTDKSVRNIGIVGPYASGKTTVLKSYEHDHGQEYIYITLGDYVRSTVEPAKKETVAEGDIQTPEIEGGTPREIGMGKAPNTTTHNASANAQGSRASEDERVKIADLQDRIIEQLLCHESPYGVWRATIARFWRGANSSSTSLHYIFFSVILILSLVISLDLFGVTTQMSTYIDSAHIASVTNKAVDGFLGKDELENNLISTAEANARRETYGEAEKLNLNDDERQKLLEANLARADEAAAKEFEDMAAAAGERAAAEASRSKSLGIIILDVFRVLCGIVSLVCVGLLVRHMVISGVAIGSLSVGSGSVDVNLPSLPFQSQIDDIIYLFRRTGCTVFVFEDLDRMDQRAEILTSLRELNYKLNTYEKMLHESKKRRRKSSDDADPAVYKFVYSIQAGCIPDAEERSKFFDFIVPIVPHGDATSFGDLLDKQLSRKKKYKPAFDLLDLAGHAVVGMRMYENLVNEYIVHRTVLSDIAEMGSEEHEIITPQTDDSSETAQEDALSSLEKTKNNLIFAIVSYKNICPLDYAKFERRRGFLHELLNVETKRALLNNLGIPEDTLQRDIMLPYVALYKKYGYLASWDTEINKVMKAIAKEYSHPNGWREAIYTFVQHALERGYIREDVRSYSTISHASIEGDDREFCDYVSAKHWNDNPLNRSVEKYYFAAVDPKAIVRTLEGCVFTANERVLNATLLDYLIKHTDKSRELRENEVDPLLEILYTMNESSGAKFFCKYISLSSPQQVEQFYAIVTSPRYSKHALLPTFESVYTSLKQTGSMETRLAVIAFLRLVHHAEQYGASLAVANGLKDCLDKDNVFAAQAWQEEWDDYTEEIEDHEIVWRTRSNSIADEVAHGLKLLNCGVAVLEGDRIEFLGALVKYDCYAINAQNIRWLLEHEKLDDRITYAITTIIAIHDDGHYLRRRLEDDCDLFVSMVVQTAKNSACHIDDMNDTIYWVLNNDALSEDLRIDYLLLCKRRIDLDRIEYHDLWVRALPRVAFKKRNVDSYLRFANVALDAYLYDYLKKYANEFAKGRAEGLADESYQILGEAAISKAQSLNEPSGVILSMRGLFGYLTNGAVHRIQARIEQLRAECRVQDAYAPLGAYIVENKDAYNDLLKDDNFKDAVVPPEIDSAIQATTVGSSVEVALMFAKTFPEHAVLCIQSLNERLVQQPVLVQRRLLCSYCELMGYDNLEELFKTGSTKHIDPYTDEWRIMHELINSDIVYEDADSFRLA